MHLSLTATADGALRLCPQGALPRLERAFRASAGRGILDLLRYGLPLDAAPILAWLRERGQELMQEHLRRLRREGNGCPLPAPEPARCRAWLEAMPPLYGAEVSASMLQGWLLSLGPALAELAERDCCTQEEWLSRLGEGWRHLGSLCFHLAENGGADAATAPFAFLASFIHKVGQDGKARHAPLGLAPKLLGADTQALLELLRPLRDVAAQNPFFDAQIQSGDIFKPQAWTARQAYCFLEAQEALETAGIETRVINLWKSQPPRVELEMRLEPQEEGGGKAGQAPSLNIHSLLHFVPRIALGDRYLTEEELAELLAGDDGLVRFKGDWLRLDREKLQELLQSWRQASRMAAGGIPLLAGLRYLLGKRREALPNIPPPEDGLRLAMGEKLAAALEQLQFGTREPILTPEQEKCLRHYQKDGVRFLCNVTEAGFGACLADDMGLGKSLQVICFLQDLKARGLLEKRAALIIAPASLLSNWQEELRRFAPQLQSIVLHPFALNKTDALYLRREPDWLLRRADVAICTYDQATRNELLARYELPALVLDEAQAIKNADSQRTKAILRLNSPRRVALSGTPVENSLSELHSLFDFLNPGLLGNSKSFNAFVKEMGTDYSTLRHMIRPFLLRRLKSDPSLLPELPPKTEQIAYCEMTPEQLRLYSREVEHLQAVIAEPDPQTRLALVLPILGHLKQICNHPAQHLGENYFEPEKSGKMLRLGQLCRQIAKAGDACLIFTQYRRMIEPLHDYLAGIFGAPGLCLHGGTPLEERRHMVGQFQDADGPRFFILSLKAAGTGLTLTRARHVIHFDRWWNPAVENQASDRAYRIGQKQPVIIHPLVCRGSIEENIQRMLAQKSAMADALLSGGLEKLLLQLSAEELMALVR